MRFPVKFTRWVGAVPAGGIALGTDTVPSIGPSNQDNLVSARFANINGWPASKLVVGMKGPATVDAKNVSFYIWEERSASWFKLPTTDTLTPDGFVYFTCPTLVDPPQVGSGYSDKSAGCLEVLVIVAANGTIPNGEYTFVVGLSTLR